MTVMPATERLGPAEEARAVLDALASDRALAVVTLVDGPNAGARLFVDDDVHGTLGDAALDEFAARAARDALATAAHEPALLALDDARMFVEVHRAAPPRNSGLRPASISNAPPPASA